MTSISRTAARQSIPGRPDDVAAWAGSAPTTVTLDGALARANVEIRDAEHRHHLRKAPHLELRVPIAMIDRMLDELEILNLLEVSRVPSSSARASCTRPDSSTGVAPRSGRSVRSSGRISRMSPS